ncbi:hypothetical protein E4U10_001429 [Claviceps purpurea]|nr:hypothetical protein E4U10_001429 [Claviceps purpurea]
MPPRKRGRGNATFTPSRARDNEATDADTPTASDVGAKPPRNRERSPHNDMWTDDQVASLFKGVIRWKPAGSYTDEKETGLETEPVLLSSSSTIPQEY